MRIDDQIFGHTEVTRHVNIGYLIARKPGDEAFWVVTMIEAIDVNIIYVEKELTFALFYNCIDKLQFRKFCCKW